MGRYVERHLYENELIVEKATIDAWHLVGRWSWVFVCCVGLACLQLIPFVRTMILGLISEQAFNVVFIALCVFVLWFVIIAAIKTIEYSCTELVLTTKRVVYRKLIILETRATKQYTMHLNRRRKRSLFRTESLDMPLDKVYNVCVETTFAGHLFNTNWIHIHGEDYHLKAKIGFADQFKSVVLGQMDYFHEARLAKQASWTANAMYRTAQQPPQDQYGGYYQQPYGMPQQMPPYMMQQQQMQQRPARPERPERPERPSRERTRRNSRSRDDYEYDLDD